MNQDRGWDADDEDEDEKMSAADREMTRPCLLETSPRPPYVLFHERLNWRWYYVLVITVFILNHTPTLYALFKERLKDTTSSLQSTL